MDKTLKQVKEFHELYDMTVNETPTVPSVQDARLRFNLILEELLEFAEAADIEMSAHLKLQNKCEELEKKRRARDRIDEGINVNLVGVLDAFSDIRYVVNGSIITYGFADMFEEAFDEVHNSNMSKTCKTDDDLNQSIGYYKGQGVEVEVVEKVIGDVTVKMLKRVPDGKLMKSISYRPANLEQIVLRNVQTDRSNDQEES